MASAGSERRWSFRRTERHIRCTFESALLGPRILGAPRKVPWRSRLLAAARAEAVAAPLGRPNVSSWHFRELENAERIGRLRPQTGLRQSGHATFQRDHGLEGECSSSLNGVVGQLRPIVQRLLRTKGRRRFWCKQWRPWMVCGISVPSHVLLALLRPSGAVALSCLPR